MSSKIMVSVCCLVYNHEKYLRKCLDGFIMQKTNFKFEVLIHDDASIDNSAEIIREYEKKYPDIIKPIYQKENQYSKGVKINWEYQYPRAKGKYIALCEGDDCWSDENKLQIQFDTMEAEKTAAMSVHTVRCIMENGKLTNRYFPRNIIDKAVLKPCEFMKIIQWDTYPFQTSSYFIRSTYIHSLINDKPEFVRIANVGDIPLMLYMVTKGDIIYIDKVMSYYRLNSIGSYNSRLNSYEKIIDHNKHMIRIYKLFNKCSGYRFNEYMQCGILNYEFTIDSIRDDHKSLVQKKYRKVVKNLPLKRKIHYYISVLIPGFNKIYRRLRNNNQKKH